MIENKFINEEISLNDIKRELCMCIIKHNKCNGLACKLCPLNRKAE